MTHQRRLVPGDASDSLFGVAMAAAESGQKQTRSQPEREATTESRSAESTTEKGEKIKEDLDRLMEEIDEVLEENAEEFVKNYVQRGGE